MIRLLLVLATAFLLVGTRLVGHAQTVPDSTARPVNAAPADTAAAPEVAPTAGAAGSVPATEFETYNASGRGLRYTAALTGLYTTGTVERVFFSTNHTANFAFRGGRWRLPVGANFSYGRQDARLKEREGLLLLTPSYQRGRFRGYALSEAGFSNLRAIERRLVHGLGAGYNLYTDSLRNEINLSYLVLYEDTRYLTDLHRQVLRHSARVKTKFTWGVVSLDALVFYQPAVRAPTTDYRINGTASLAVRLTQRLAFTTAYTYSYESISVAGRSPANGNLSAGLAYATSKK
ncbi:DUF481 domain-containing protein [Hymenobacter sp. B1770]|uniref:DUF481 domain-containing protein n=1 Tax=Hymenobacter sp. B1770 TaxID=1718788 RepID=UPI003CF9D696